MFGKKGTLSDESAKAEWGFFPRLTDVTIQMMKNEGNKYILTISALEFYMFAGYDLLNDHAPITIDPKMGELNPAT